jgi:hypothetical protein
MEANPSRFVVIVDDEVQNYGEAQRLAMHAITSQGCWKVVLYDPRRGEHPKTERLSWRMRLSADCRSEEPYPAAERWLYVSGDGATEWAKK